MVWVACWVVAVNNFDTTLKILFASGNPHKLEEARAILPEINWLSLADFPELKNLNPEETGKTFEDNAEIKARAYGVVSGVVSVAEDAGLEVAALNNEPGVYSARWVPGSDRDRYETLLKRLGGNTNRQAQFVAVICWFDPASGQLEFFRGEMPGSIALEARGNNGFGYDPVFIPEGYDQTFAELGSKVKHQISHRQRALERFSQWLKTRSSKR